METAENLILRMLPSWRASVLLRYAITTAIVLLFFSLRLALDASLHTFPVLLLFPAVFIASLLFDRGSGFVATFESAILIGWFLLPPHPGGPIEIEQWFGLVVFVAICLMMAITTEMLRTALERVAASEREKDMLLDEVNHRVRNDLQTATALLLAGSRKVDPVTARALEDAAGRIEVLSRVYAKLGRTDSRTEVDAHEFLTELIDDLGRAAIGLRAITLRRFIEPAPMSLDCASSVGLIVYEAVTNALKYAFPDGEEGEIEVRFGLDGEEFVLRVRDDGEGSDPGVTPRGTGLGRKLMRQMAAKLHGKLACERDPSGGTEVELRFPKDWAAGL